MKLSFEVQQVIQKYAEKFPIPIGDEAASQEWTHKLCQQLKFDFPDSGWGHKSAGAGRPHSKDTVALRNPFIGWDVIVGAGTMNPSLALNGDSIDLTGQAFEEVEAMSSLSSDVVQTSSLDPAYLTAAIKASWKGMNGTEISPEQLVYWMSKASVPDVYSDGITRVGWNAYWEARMAPGNTGAADPALANQPARYQPGGSVPVPEPPDVPPSDLNVEILAELKKHTILLTAIAGGFAQLPGQLNEALTKLDATISKGIKIRF